MNRDEQFMQRCLELAALGRYSVAPNPMVGCVIVENDKIVAEGYHHQYGEAHAEIDALSKLPPEYDLSNAEVFVSLEPCSHHGKTPPCADQLILRNPKRIVIATQDPNPKVAGAGIHRLKHAGIAVEVGVLERQAMELNKHFFTYHTKKRPFVTLKWARSSDGFMGKIGEQVWLTGEFAAKLVHKWRAGHMAILVGAKTVLTDQPRLNVRHWKGNDPIRVLFDSNLDVEETHSFFDSDKQTLVFNFSKEGVSGSVEWLRINPDEAATPQILDALGARQIISVLVEGGAQTLASFVKESCWDEAYELVAPQEIQGDIDAPELTLETSHRIMLGEDECLTYKNPQPC